MANTTSGTVTFDKTFAIDEIIADLSTDPNMTAKKFTNVKRK